MASSGLSRFPVALDWKTRERPKPRSISSCHCAALRACGASERIPVTSSSERRAYFKARSDVSLPSPARSARVWHVLPEVLQRDGCVRDPISILIGIVVQGARVRARNADSLGVPYWRSHVLGTLWPEVVHVAAQDIPLEVEVHLRLGGVRRQHHFKAVVFRNSPIVFAMDRGDVGVFGNHGEVHMRVIKASSRLSAL
jgi:hypothetical protein